MKKIGIIISVILSFLLFSNVHAMDIFYYYETSTDSAMLFDNNSKLGILSGRTMFFGVEHDKANRVGKVDVTINVSSDVQITTDNSELNSGDRITGSGGNYTIQVNSNDDSTGIGVFKLKFPTVNKVKEYSVSINAKEYDKSNSQISNMTHNYTFYVFAKKSACTENTNVNIKSNDGSVKKKSKLIYELSTKKSSIEFTLTPEDSKTNILFTGYASEKNEKEFSKPKTLTNGKTGTIPLDMGRNQVYFELETECSRLSDENQKYVEKCDNVLDEELRDTFGGGDVIISVKRIDTRSKVNTLSSLSISGAKIDFKPELKNYIVTVPYSSNKVTITSTLTDPKSSYVKNYGNRAVDLKVGSNTVEIKTKAENGSKATYTIKITRSKNDDSSLKQLKVNDSDILLKVGELVYSTTVPNEVTKPTITAVANDAKAKVVVDKIESLIEGMNIVNITVTSQSGTKSVYELTINREKIISDNSKLKSIQITNNNINFSPETLEYSIKVEKDVDKLDFIVNTDSEKATYKIIGNKDLKNGSVIKIKVVAEDEISTTTYTINIEKEETKLNILFIIIPSILIIVAILIVLILKNKNNKPKMNSISNYQTNNTPYGNTYQNTYNQPNQGVYNQTDQGVYNQTNQDVYNQTNQNMNNGGGSYGN